jgi:peptide/nickel transport system substrate-binding protein
MKQFKLTRAGLVSGISVLVLASPILAPSNAGAGTGPARAAAAAVASSVTVDTSSPPNSLDPQEGYTTSAGEADWIVYTPLLTYAHKSGLAGTRIIPGLATSLPQISGGGRTYTLYLRKGLKYSNGQPVMASDFKFAV